MVTANRISLLCLLLIILIFSPGCGGGGGGQGYDETGTPSLVTSSECMQCHGTKTTLSDGTPLNDLTGPVTDPIELAQIKADIVDTHYDNWRIGSDGYFYAVATTQIEGYVLNNATSWAPKGMGYVLRNSANACYASCHNYHNTDMVPNRQWYNSGHADINSLAFTDPFTSGACIRCHSGIGYANYVDSSNTVYPNWTAPTTERFGHHITCNACHDAQAYPTATDKRLRKTGAAILISGSGNTSVSDATLNARTSATCITCHQGRESGWSLYKAMRNKGVEPYDATDGTITGQRFINPHYAAAGAVLFSLKGYEFSASQFNLTPPFAGTYTRGWPTHQAALCRGCHMAASSDADLGGHTYKMISGSKKNISTCQSQGCHPAYTDFDPLVLEPNLENLKTLIIATLNASGIYYNPDKNPYFFTDPPTYNTPVTTWNESQLLAAFNLQFVNKEPGAYVHNYNYAVQLLWDSCYVLGIPAANIPVARPVTPYERPATTYTYP